MPLASDRQCPRCLRSVALMALWRAAPTGRWGLVLDGKFGIMCPHCGAKWRVIQTPMRFVIAATFASIIGVSLYFGNTLREVAGASDRRVVMAGVLALYVILILLLRYLVPKLAELRILQANEPLHSPFSDNCAPDFTPSTTPP